MTVVLAYKTNCGKIIMAADKRSTAGTTIVDRNTTKIHQCRHFAIGISGDSELSADLTAGYLSLDDIKATYKELKTKLYPRITAHVVKRKKEKPVNTEWYLHNDHYCLIATKDKIRYLDCFGEVSDFTDRGYAAIGNWSPYVEWYLCGQQLNPNAILRDEDAVIACHTAARHCTNIWREVDTIVVGEE